MISSFFFFFFFNKPSKSVRTRYYFSATFPNGTRLDAIQGLQKHHFIVRQTPDFRVFSRSSCEHFLPRPLIFFSQSQSLSRSIFSDEKTNSSMKSCTRINIILNARCFFPSRIYMCIIILLYVSSNSNPNTDPIINLAMCPQFKQIVRSHPRGFRVFLCISIVFPCTSVVHVILLVVLVRFTASFPAAGSGTIWWGGNVIGRFHCSR